MKILFLNNYEMDSAWIHWQQGDYPGHHLWGATGLSDLGIEVRILPYERFNSLNRSWRIQRLLGMNQLQMVALDQQVRALVYGKYDVLYSACQKHTFLLAYLRGRGIFKKPIIATMHHPVSVVEAKQLSLLSHDRLICLSEKVRNTLISDIGVPKHQVIKMDWGVDLSFYKRTQRRVGITQNTGLPIVVSAGKSKRDYSTLIHAAKKINCQLRIYCSSSSQPSEAIMPDNVTITCGGRNENALSYRELLTVYEESDVIAIPLLDVHALAGLTSLLDAMAMGKPVIMTRNDFIDIDIEKEGIGRWVNAGDTAAWESALLDILSNPTEAREMGRRGRALCEIKYNIANYTRNLANVITSVQTKCSV